ncbi:MAG: M6 family metalloprotease domain-containing protein [Robiginitomaculum sp.]|nr:M6 family metalloprotease domain-containing protein [Robiginitomaculum sp.]
MNNNFNVVKFVFVLIMGLLYALPALAVQPPSKSEAQRMRQVMAMTGDLTPEIIAEQAEIKRKLKFMRDLGNHKIDPHLFNKAILGTAREFYIENGMSKKQVDITAPQSTVPTRWRGMPTTGDVRVFALLIDFSDLQSRNDASVINVNLFGGGTAANFSQDSMANYYDRASYGQLDLSNGSTLGWYRPAMARADIPQNTAGREALIRQAIESFDAGGHDFSQYDNNNDGRIDYFLVIWSGPDNGWGNFWWGYQTSYSNSAFVVDGVTLGKYSWQWESRPVGGTFHPRVVIHETGHALGLPDYYDYDNSVGPRGGVGGLDIMHGNWGDHGCFSKWVLGWLEPTVIASGSQNITLRDSGTTKDCAVLWPGLASANHYSEMFIFQNRHRTGNDTGWPSDGILAWHVDATLNVGNFDYLYNNSFTTRKLLRLMEADGLEEIESGGSGDAGDFYTAGQVLDPTSSPSTLRYSGVTSGVSLSSIPTPSNSMTVTVAIGAQETLVVTPETSFVSSIEPGGTPTVSSMDYVLRNSSAIPFDWIASSSVNWMDVSTSSGTLAAGADVTITVSLNSEADALPAGTNLGELVFSNTTLGIGGYKRPIEFTVSIPPANDNFATSELLNGINGSTSGANEFASEESGEPKHGGVTNGGKSLWWKWVPVASGEVVIDTAGSNFDTIMSVYGGRSMASLTTIAFDDDGVGAGGASRVTFTAQSGMPYYIAVDGWNKRTGNITLNWARSNTAPALLSSILPTARSGIIGAALTAFASLINSGSNTATGCSIARPAGETATFGFQTTTPANVLTGTANAPVDVIAGATQNFVFEYTPNRVMQGSQIGLVFDCTNTSPAPSVPGLNRFTVSSDNVAVADLIAIAATVSNDGIINIPGETATGFFSASAVNIGPAATITAYVDDAGAGLTLEALICTTDALGNCDAAPASQVSFTLATDEVVLLAVFVTGQGNVTLDAANNRLFLRFDESATPRGATSVAVRTFVD